jgi:hypothetical protein
MHSLARICNPCQNIGSEKYTITFDQQQGHGLQIRASLFCELSEAKSTLTIIFI